MIEDRIVDYSLVASEQLLNGRVWDVERVTVALPHGDNVVRDFVKHTGAVGIIAVNELGQVLLLEQYRAPLNMVMWEPPAGLLDVADETPLDCAKRELFEESGWRANDWQVLTDFATSPGGSSEVVRIFLATDVYADPFGRPIGEGEEFEMPLTWVPVGDILESINAGKVNNPILIIGVQSLVLAMAESGGLRNENAPWNVRNHLKSGNRLRNP